MIYQVGILHVFCSKKVMIRLCISFSYILEKYDNRDMGLQFCTSILVSSLYTGTTRANLTRKDAFSERLIYHTS